MNPIVSGMGFHHIALRARSFDESVRFYEAIGCKVKVAWGSGENRAAMIDLGDGGCIELFSGGAEAATESDVRYGEWLHLAVTCDDPDAAFAAAVDAGAKVKYAPYDVDLSSDPPLPLRIAFVYGPNGEVIEFFHVRKKQ